jgi:(1->4)-alpha-D-glucan 1-alpha-D-glucosylmutase
MAEWNSKARVLLHLTMPGTPDIYQGDETWSFTLVDPDNRQPVKYPAEASSKLDLTRRILAVRRDYAELFADGSYIPLSVSGPRADNVVAFERRLGDQRAIVVAPRLTGSEDWGETDIAVGDGSLDLRCALTDNTPIVRDGKIQLNQVPFQLLLARVRP